MNSNCIDEYIIEQQIHILQSKTQMCFWIKNNCEDNEHDVVDNKKYVDKYYIYNQNW